MTQRLIPCLPALRGLAWALLLLTACSSPPTGVIAADVRKGAIDSGRTDGMRADGSGPADLAAETRHGDVGARAELGPAADARGADSGGPAVQPQLCGADGWCWVSPLEGANLKATWSAAPNDVWAAGDYGALIHWNGSIWTSDPGAGQMSIFGRGARAQATSGQWARMGIAKAKFSITPARRGQSQRAVPRA